MPDLFQLFWRLFLLFGLLSVATAQTMRVAYVHGDVSADGQVPSGLAEPYDQMLLSDSGSRGLSIFKGMVEGEGFVIDALYDQETVLSKDVLDNYRVLIFGLHQKLWNEAEKGALDRWLRSGGGILIYSDSASGGHFGTVGIRNSVGQQVVNNLISDYGMEVTVDHGGGRRSYRPGSNAVHPLTWDRLIFEGEGVSPVAVDTLRGARVLIPFDDAFKVEGSSLAVDHQQNITITSPVWAALAESKVGAGRVLAIFDRQPMWNNGPGSDIERRDNLEILRRIVHYLAGDYGNSPSWFRLSPKVQLRDAEPYCSLLLQYRRWSGGSPTPEGSYRVRNGTFRLEVTHDLSLSQWSSGLGISETVGLGETIDEETERVSERLLAFQPDSSEAVFARIRFD